MQQLRDRIAEMMRKARLGDHGGRWVEQTMETKMDWLRSADTFMDLGRDFGVVIMDVDDFRAEISGE